jgi:hypothetical protein
LVSDTQRVMDSAEDVETGHSIYKRRLVPNVVIPLLK